MSRYRPWGLLDWLLPKTSVQSWSLLACIGTEERSLVAWETLRRLGVLGFASFVRLLPHGHNRFSQQTAQLFQQRLAEFRALGGRDQDVSEIELLVRYGDIVDFVDRFLARGHSSVALDLSVLPKRFFFPFVRRIMDRRPAVENFVAIYTRPQKYTEGPLSENPAEWDHLPLFSGSPTYTQPIPESLVIGVGFEPLGLQAHVEQGGVPVRLLLPFPSAPEAYRRSWEFARILQKHRDPQHVRLYRTHSFDPSDTFDRLASLTNGGKSRTVLAPYGPKPMSLGMCLFARLTETPVYYTQPTVYSPAYSHGVAVEDGSRMTYGYVIRLANQDMFTL